MAYKWFIFAVLLMLTGCNDDDDNNPTSMDEDNSNLISMDEGDDSISMEDFEQKVINLAGTDAIDCGKVETNESSLLAVNTCVSDSFILNISFYSFYIIQGIDSNVVNAVSMNLSGVVEYWYYDSFGKGNISSTVCENPTLTFDLNDINVIECTN